MKSKFQIFSPWRTLLFALTVLVVAVSKTNAEPTSQEQQIQNNLLALSLAQNLSITSVLSSVDDRSWTNIQNSIEWQAFRVKHNDYKSVLERDGVNINAANTIEELCSHGLVTEPKVIPYLIDALNHPDRDVVGQQSLRALSYMTRRMLGVVCRGGDEYQIGGYPNDIQRHNRIISWWKDWWKNNENKHPVYDHEIDQEVQKIFLNAGKIIEDKVKPDHAELGLFKAQAQTDLYLNGCLSVLYEYQYEPYQNDMGLPKSSNGSYFIKWDELPWMEIKCRFEDQEMPTPWVGYIVHHPPKRLENFLTTVYSKKIDGSGIIVEVNIASPNKALVEDLKKALNP